MRRGLVVLLLLLGACSGGGDSGGGADSSLACDHFRNVSGDAAAGLFTNEELRDKLREVYDNAAIASARVENAARDLLAAATEGNELLMKSAIRRLGAACDDEGL